MWIFTSKAEGLDFRRDLCYTGARTWQERRLLALGDALKLGRCKEIRR